MHVLQKSKQNQSNSSFQTYVTFWEDSQSSVNTGTAPGHMTVNQPHVLKILTPLKCVRRYQPLSAVTLLKQWQMSTEMHSDRNSWAQTIFNVLENLAMQVDHNTTYSSILKCSLSSIFVSLLAVLLFLSKVTKKSNSIWLNKVRGLN